MKEFYTDTNFRPASLDLIGKIERIMQEYIADGFVLTVRQLYYQLVARDIIPNTERSYKNTVSLVARRLIAFIGKSRFSTATCQQSKGS